MARRKVMEINEGRYIIECIKDDSVKFNPYRVYQKWYNAGWHRKQIEKYANFESVIYFLVDFMHTHDTGWNKD